MTTVKSVDDQVADLEQKKADLEQAKIKLEQAQVEFEQAYYKYNKANEEIIEKEICLLISDNDDDVIVDTPPLRFEVSTKKSDSSNLHFCVENRLKSYIENEIKKIEEFDEKLAEKRKAFIALTWNEKIIKIIKEKIIKIRIDQCSYDYETEDKLNMLVTLSKPTLFLVITEFDKDFGHFKDQDNDNSNKTMIVELVRASSEDDACERSTASEVFELEYGEDIGSTNAHDANFVVLHKCKFEHRVIQYDCSR